MAGNVDANSSVAIVSVVRNGADEPAMRSSFRMKPASIGKPAKNTAPASLIFAISRAYSFSPAMMVAVIGLDLLLLERGDSLLGNRLGVKRAVVNDRDWLAAVCLLPDSARPRTLGHRRGPTGRKIEEPARFAVRSGWRVPVAMKVTPAAP